MSEKKKSREFDCEDNFDSEYELKRFDQKNYEPRFNDQKNLESKRFDQKNFESKFNEQRDFEPKFNEQRDFERKHIDEEHYGLEHHDHKQYKPEHHDHDHCEPKHHNHKNCEPKHHDPKVCIGKIVVKVPVVLAEVELEASVDTTITFPEPVLEIKDIKKRLKITQCTLLLPTNKLFIKGFVRKNIQYASPCSDIATSNSTSVASDLHSFTVDVPFQIISDIKNYLSRPVLPEMNKRSEFDFFVSKPLPSGFPEKDELLTSDLSEFHQNSSQFYNEAPFCELISSKIIEWDEAIDRQPLPNSSPIDEGFFTTIEEKMVIDFTVKVLQNQQVRVSSTTNDYDD